MNARVQGAKNRFGGLLQGDDFSAIGQEARNKLGGLLEGDDFSAIGQEAKENLFAVCEDCCTAIAKVQETLEGDDFSAIGQEARRDLRAILEACSAANGPRADRPEYNSAASGQVTSKTRQLEAAMFLMEGKLTY